MSDRKIFVIIAYDIQKQNTRTKLANLLIEFGLERVNKSVFEGQLHQQQFMKKFRTLCMELRKEDSVIIYTVNEQIVKGKELFLQKPRRRKKTEPQIV
jgi:CRISPR-associated endonuclease Cas2